MIDQPQAATLARAAYDQWQAGQHAASRLLYEEALPLADPQHYALPSYYGEYACVLNALGQHALATTQLEQALAIEMAHGFAEGSPPVIAARYFLADQLLRHGDKQCALATLGPSIIHAPCNWITRIGEAHILYALDRKPEARAAAELAVAHAPSPEKAEELKQNLHVIFDHPATSP